MDEDCKDISDLMKDTGCPLLVASNRKPETNTNNNE